MWSSSGYVTQPHCPWVGVLTNRKICRTGCLWAKPVLIPILHIVYSVPTSLAQLCVAIYKICIMLTQCSLPDNHSIQPSD